MHGLLLVLALGVDGAAIPLRRLVPLKEHTRRTFASPVAALPARLSFRSESTIEANWPLPARRNVDRSGGDNPSFSPARLCSFLSQNSKLTPIQDGVEKSAGEGRPASKTSLEKALFFQRHFSVQRVAAKSAGESRTPTDDSIFDCAQVGGGDVHTTLQRNYEFGVYIHLPYCLRRCHFCAFPILLLPNSSAEAAAAAAEGHLPLLRRDLQKEFSLILQRHRQRLEFLQSVQKTLSRTTRGEAALGEKLRELEAQALAGVGGWKASWLAALFKGAVVRSLGEVAALNGGWNEGENVASDAPKGGLLRSVFFGGGTPSLLPVSVVRTLLSDVFSFEKQFAHLIRQQAQTVEELRRFLPKGLQPRGMAKAPLAAEPEVTVEIYPGTNKATQLLARLTRAAGTCLLGDTSLKTLF